MTTGLISLSSVHSVWEVMGLCALYQRGGSEKYFFNRTP